MVLLWCTAYLLAVQVSHTKQPPMVGLFHSTCGGGAHVGSNCHQNSGCCKTVDIPTAANACNFSQSVDRHEWVSSAGMASLTSTACFMVVAADSNAVASLQSSSSVGSALGRMSVLLALVAFHVGW